MFVRVESFHVVVVSLGQQLLVCCVEHPVIIAQWLKPPFHVELRSKSLGKLLAVLSQLFVVVCCHPVRSGLVESYIFIGIEFPLIASKSFNFPLRSENSLPALRIQTLSYSCNLNVETYDLTK